MARIALDIDSTLHHYWDLFEQLARERYGVALPYAQQTSWAIASLRPEEVRALVAETHRDEHILSAEPYPHAVETVATWHRQGHWIHITSHRALDAHGATARWLDRIGMPYDDLHCSYDKVPRCVELGIDVLIDDSPVNLERALEAGIAAATLVHPWNEDLARAGGVTAARDWLELRELIEPLLR